MLKREAMHLLTDVNYAKVQLGKHRDIARALDAIDRVEEALQSAVFSQRMWLRVWKLLALEGACDDLGGAQYDRVSALWDQAEPADVMAAFIRYHANTDAEHTQEARAVEAEETVSLCCDRCGAWPCNCVRNS